MKVGNTVLMKNLLPGNKLTTTFGRNEYEVMSKDGSRVTVKDKTSGKIYRRNVAHLKRIDSSHEGTNDSLASVAPCEPANPELSPSNSQADGSRLNLSEHSRTRRTLKLPSRFKDYEC